jgi:plastocyanin
MPRKLLSSIVAFALLILSTPVLAGGYAVVRLDEPPGDVAAGTPWRFGFMVLQHDITPNSDVTPVVTAWNRETGEEITATGVQQGPVGHFVAEITFPSAGEWKWQIMPEPFAETSFETLVVGDGGDALGGQLVNGDATLQASISRGFCGALGDIAYPLGAIAMQEPAVKSPQLPVAVAVSTIDAALPSLLAGEHAIGVSEGETDSELVACANIENLAGEASDSDEVVLGLRGWADSGRLGIAVLRDEGKRTAVSVYLLASDPQPAPEMTEGVTVEVSGSTFDVAAFQPASLTIPVGTTVRWLNTSPEAHTITGDDLAFADSGVIDPGQSFRQTFAEAGTFHYRCGPHPWMEGVIVVQ